MTIDSNIVLGIAKESIKKKIVEGINWLPDLSNVQYSYLTRNQGAFTTIYNLDGSLRGCIGIPYPSYPLAHSIAISARKSATVDPRFPPLKSSELNEIYLEVEALSEINKIQYETIDELISQIDVGKHGLIVKFNQFGGLLLPKVGARYNWDALDLVQHTCQKAGLLKSDYTKKGIEFYYFTSELFSEEK